MNSNTPVSPRWNKNGIKCATVASISCFLIGFNIAVLGELLIHINKDKRMPAEKVELRAGYLHGFSIFGAIAVGWISDRIGRWHTMVGTGVFFIFGTLLVSFFPNNALLLLGRAITQVGVGFIPMITTNYMAEVSPASSRGLVTTIPVLSLNFGTFFGHGFNYIASMLDSNFGARVILSLGVILAAVLAIGFRVMPESPQWLVTSGRESDAMCVLAMIYGSEEEAARRLADIVEANIQANRDSVRWDLCHPTRTTRHMLICAGGIQFFQQFCGVETIILYGPSFYDKAGITSYNWKLLWTAIIHFVKAVTIVIPTLFLDKFGRVWLLLGSISGLVVSLFILGCCLIEIDQNGKPEWAVATSMLVLLCCTGFYSMGLGPVASVYSAEVFPQQLRSKGYAFGVATNQAASALLAFTFLPLYEAISLGGAMFIFMVFAILAWLFVYLAMPETNGQNLEEIWRDFGRLIVWRRSEARREIELPSSSATHQQ